MKGAKAVELIDVGVIVQRRGAIFEPFCEGRPVKALFMDSLKAVADLAGRGGRCENPIEICTAHFSDWIVDDLEVEFEQGTLHIRADGANYSYSGHYLVHLETGA